MGNEVKQSFNDIKTSQSKPPVRVYPDFEKPFRVSIDESKRDTGTIPEQFDPNGRETPIMYDSHCINIVEQNYFTIERETLALAFAFVELFPIHPLRALCSFE